MMMKVVSRLLLPRLHSIGSLRFFQGMSHHISGLASLTHVYRCLWGLIVTRFVWPISARQKFKDGLSILWFRMGLIWKRDPLAMLTEGGHPNAYMDLREEFELHRFLSRLENLKSSAASEVDFRGPFPDAAYSRILRSTAAMLDAFHAMNVMIKKNPKATKAEAEILEHTAKERTYLSTRISHLFQGNHSQSLPSSSRPLIYPQCSHPQCRSNIP